MYRNWLPDWSSLKSLNCNREMFLFWLTGLTLSRWWDTTCFCPIELQATFDRKKCEASKIPRSLIFANRPMSRNTWPSSLRNFIARRNKLGVLNIWDRDKRLVSTLVRRWNLNSLITKCLSYFSSFNRIYYRSDTSKHNFSSLLSATK